MTNALASLFELARHADIEHPGGVTSVCSAHPLVIEAALLESLANGGVACIEATCNQVNQDGGYTGMNPAGFRDFVLEIARRVGFPSDRILFGGDHLGPNPWRKLPAAEAMQKAMIMIDAYAVAGFGKLHLDASMSCADDPVPLPDATIAERASRLAAAAEAGRQRGGQPAPAYIIGTEVPVPGGAAEKIETLDVTRADAAAETLALHKRAFAVQNLSAAFDRVVGLVVQPGVEFGNANVVAFQPGKARALSDWRRGTRIVFEAHSTDYQSAANLSALVAGGFRILKVGPGLTFAMREALYGLDQIAGILAPGYGTGALWNAVEQAMQAAPGNWDGYYRGTEVEMRVQRHFSYSDRIRYYWTAPAAEAAVARLFDSLDGLELPEPLISQFLSRLYGEVVAGNVRPRARDLVIASIRGALSPYSRACHSTANR